MAIDNRRIEAPATDRARRRSPPIVTRAVAVLTGFWRRPRHPSKIRRSSPGPSTQTATIVIISLLCAVLVGHDLLRTWQDRTHWLDEGARETANLALAEEEHAADAFRLAEAVLGGLVERAEADGVSPGRRGRLRAIMLGQTTRAKFLINLGLVDETGTVIVAATPAGEGLSIADQAFFQYHRDNSDPRPSVSPVLPSREPGELRVVVSRRVDGPGGVFAGVAFAAINVMYFQDFYATFNLKVDGIAGLFRDDGLVLSRHPFLKDAIGGSAAGSSLFTKELLHAPVGTFEIVSRLDGVTRILSYRRVAGYPLVVFAALGKSEQLEKWRVAAGEHLIAGLACVSLLGLIAVRLVLHVRRLTLAEQETRSATALAAAMELRMAALVESAADAIVTKDVNGVVQTWNPGAERMLGYAAKEIVGENVMRLVPDDGRDEEAVILARIRAGQRVESFETTRRARDGARIEVSVTISPLRDVDGRVIGASTIMRDISALKHAEAELRQAQKMEVIGRLAAGVSHDFNNILQVIGGGVEILRDEPHLSIAATEFLDMIDRATRRGAYLTHHLLAYSRKQVLEPQTVDMGQLLEELSIVLSRTLGTDIVVSVEFDNLAGAVRADRAQLETALMNLAINASHAMPDGGSLRLDVQGVDGAPFGELKAGRHVVIGVTDNGTGMPPDVLARVFEPFFTTKGLDGTGLGLAMVHGFSRQSGGDVRAFSTPGEGTRFEIWLPEVEAPLSFGIAAAPPMIRKSAGRVLLVDDASDVLVTLGAFLTAAGLAVARAEGGKEALLMLEAGERFDLLVTDYLMPTMKGPELIRQVRLFQPNLPAIVISGFADVGEFMAELPNAFMLIKPFQRHQLIERVNALIAANMDAPAGDVDPARDRSTT